MRNYGLYPALYFTAPGPPWDAMIKKTGFRLRLLKVLMLERRMRDGISQCCRRYAKANNKLVNWYDRSQESTYLVYLYSNNIYGYSMSQPLPVGCF